MQPLVKRFGDLLQRKNLRSDVAKNLDVLRRQLAVVDIPRGEPKLHDVRACLTLRLRSEGLRAQRASRTAFSSRLLGVNSQCPLLPPPEFYKMSIGICPLPHCCSVVSRA